MRFDIENHLKHFPHAAIMEKESRIAGIWMIGNNYRRTNDYHGSYPPSYIQRILTLFPGEDDILHLFAGMVEGPGLRFDCNPELNPDVCGNAEEVDNYFTEDMFRLVLADPPYTTKDAEIYGYKMPRANIVLQKLYNIVTEGGVVVWLSTKRPMYRKEQWRLAGMIGLDCGTNRVFRAVTFLERV